MAKVPNGIETLPKISIAWVGRTNVTDRRQTDRRTTAYQREFTFAKNYGNPGEKIAETKGFNLTKCSKTQSWLFFMSVYAGIVLLRTGLLEKFIVSSLTFSPVKHDANSEICSMSCHRQFTVFRRLCRYSGTKCLVYSVCLYSVLVTKLRLYSVSRLNK